MKCVVCHHEGEPRDCCPDRPVLCDQHAAEHMLRVHGEGAGTRRSVDEALLEAMETEGFDDG